jgi:hypothetical protein
MLLPGCVRPFHIVLVITVGLVASVTARAAESGTTAAGAPPPKAERTAPVIDAVYTKTPPVIDGKLDDACWSQASRVEGFSCPGVDTPPPDETIGLVILDEQYLYAGFICRDKTPSDISAKETRRNGDVGRDDSIALALDPWHQHNDFYQFTVTAAGTQAEQIPGGSATKIEWRGDWRGAATRTPEGYQIEMAIPLAILPHPPGQSTFGLAVVRNWAQENIVAICPDTGRNVDTKLLYDLVGLRLPKTVLRPTIMSYSTFDSAGVGGNTAKAGVDLQYKLRSGLTALASANPDFKQVEDSVEPVSFSYTERYLPDLRPFFVTGQDGYLPREHLLYTRRIEQFDAGAKVFGTIGNDTVGLLDAYTHGQQNALAASWRHQFSPENSAKLLLVSDTRPGEEAGGLAYGLDMSHARNTPQGSDSIWSVLYHADSKEDGAGSAYSLGGYHDRGSGKLHWDWMARYATESFKPSLGYYPDINNYGAAFGFGTSRRLDKGALESRDWYVGAAYYPFLDGSGVMDATISPSYNWSWRDGRRLGLGFTRGRQYNFDSSDAYLSYGWNSKDLYENGHAALVKGNRAGGDYTYLELGQGFRPASRLSVRLTAGYDSLVGSEDSDGHNFQGVLTSSYDITNERSVGLRVIARNSGFTGYMAYRQVVRRGMDVYVLLGDPDPELTHFSPRLMIKLIRTM